MPAVIRVSVEGQRVLTWEGDENAIVRLFDEAPRAARPRRPEQLAATSILHLHRYGRFIGEDSIGQRGEVMHIVWLVLNTPFDDPERPEARVADCAASSTIDVDFEIIERGGKPTVRGRVKGVTKLDG